MSRGRRAIRLAVLVAVFGALHGGWIELASESIDAEWPAIFAAAGRSLFYFGISVAVVWWCAKAVPAWLRLLAAAFGGALLLTAIEYVPQAVRYEFGSGWREAFSPSMLARPFFFGALVATGAGVTELTCRAISSIVRSVNLSSPAAD